MYKESMRELQVLTSSVRTQESTVRALREQSQLLNDLSRSQHVVSECTKAEVRFEAIAEGVKELLSHCHTALDSHNSYADALQDARIWLNNADERLRTCSDAFNDKHALIACKQKV